MTTPRLALLLAPFDAAVANVSGRRGAAGGPDALHAELAARGLLEGVAVHRARSHNTGELLEADLAELAELMTALCAESDRVLVLGGDNGITYATALGVSRHRPLGGLAYVDVHWDLRPFDPHTSGSSFRRLLEEGVIAAPRLCPIGIVRPSAAGQLARSRFVELEQYALARGVQATPFAQARSLGLANVLVDRLVHLPPPRYLSLDLDAVDERDLPGVSAPGSGRFALSEVIDAARAAAPHVVAVDLVELAPALDPSGRSTRAAADVAGAILDAWRAMGHADGKS
jgi:arginase family enzyme